MSNSNVTTTKQRNVTYLYNLPMDILCTLCRNYITPTTILNLALTNVDLMNRIINAETIWSYKIKLAFPKPSLLELKVVATSSLKGYRRRLKAKRRELKIVPGTYTLTGHSCDSGSGNTTPATSVIVVSSYFFSGNVKISKGTIHNNGCEGTWTKGYFGALGNSWLISWEEKLPTNRGKFIYEGTLDKLTGTIIEGTFKWNVMPKVHGTFGFKVVRTTLGSK